MTMAVTDTMCSQSSLHTCTAMPAEGVCAMLLGAAAAAGAVSDAPELLT